MGIKYDPILGELRESDSEIEITGVVRSVNGNLPDENGNVEIETDSGNIEWNTEDNPDSTSNVKWIK